jgi:outer membrane protein assembly factor BamB
MKREGVSTRGLRLVSLKWWVFGGATALAIGIICSAMLAAIAAGGPDWPSYQLDNGRSGYNSAETTINPTSAKNLKLHWTHTAAGAISTEPVEANNLVYWGSWDGYEHATDHNNNKVWTANLGTTTDTSCNPVKVGVASTATVATVNGTSMLFVGGGNAHFYALNAKTGAIIWSITLGSSPANFIWSSPLYYNGSVYVGLASFGDCPLVQGQMEKINASNGALQYSWHVVKSGCTGGGVSGSPTIDTATGDLFFATGNPGSCSSTELNVPAIIRINSSNMAFIDSWTVPKSQQIVDSDFVNTPTLFQNGGTPMVGASNKNGKFYALNRSNLGAGPPWTYQVANSGDCPQCGGGSISPAAWDGSTLYVAGGAVGSCKGSLNALSGNGSRKWQHCFSSGAVLGAVSAVPGVVVVGEGTYVNVQAASDGSSLFNYHDTNSGSAFWSGASISNGVIYIGNQDGHLYALGT